jgi:hypothetical protein
MNMIYKYMYNKEEEVEEKKKPSEKVLKSHLNTSKKSIKELVYSYFCDSNT